MAESIKARKALIEGLEKILDTNRVALEIEEAQYTELSIRKHETDTKKRDVEDTIMRGFNPNSNPGTPAGNGSPAAASQSPITPAPEPDRPEVEALTPPGYSKPPMTEPIPEFDLLAKTGNGSLYQASTPPAPGSDLMSSLSKTYETSYARPTSVASVKKRKLDSDFPDLGGDAMDGLDADVAEMLMKDSNKNGH